MLRDKRDEFDENEDADLTGMIHQYHEDNELRRKINEMKKQKEEEKKQETADIYDDDVFLASGLNKDDKDKEERIPDIQADGDVEKTRVGFRDESDKTLVIMDRKNKMEREEEEEPFTETELHHTRELEEDDLRERIRRKKDVKNEDDDEEEESDKEKKINKTIMYVIIGVLSVALLVGIGFGVKALFFSGNSDEKITDTDKEDKETTNKKDKDKTNKKDDSEIKDNSAVIKQLTEQQNTYQEQLDQVNRDITKAQNDANAAQASLDNITALYNDMNSLQRQMSALGSSLSEVEGNMQAACNIDTNSQECLDTTTVFNQYSNLNSQYNLKKQQYDIENAKTNTYLNNKKAAGDKVTSLQQQKTDLEKKIAEIETKLAGYDD